MKHVDNEHKSYLFNKSIILSVIKIVFSHRSEKQNKKIKQRAAYKNKQNTGNEKQHRPLLLLVLPTNIWLFKTGGTYKNAASANRRRLLCISQSASACEFVFHETTPTPLRSLFMSRQPRTQQWSIYSPRALWALLIYIFMSAPVHTAAKHNPPALRYYFFLYWKQLVGLTDGDLCVNFEPDSLQIESEWERKKWERKRKSATGKRKLFYFIVRHESNFGGQQPQINFQGPMHQNLTQQYLCYKEPFQKL